MIPKAVEAPRATCRFRALASLMWSDVPDTQTSRAACQKGNLARDFGSEDLLRFTSLTSTHHRPTVLKHEDDAYVG